MNTKTLYQKTGRYICGVSRPAETRQIQTWLSCTNPNKPVASEEERNQVEQKILREIQHYTAYPLFFPGGVTRWEKWKSLFR